ncbi:MAG: hypothetical protein ABR589_02785 [Chthoniobacterales bacterium]
MADDEPESLWNFGEPEPWRRGRAILLSIAAFFAIVQALIFLAALLGGALEGALALAISFALWWLAFAFIWLGTHWVRWLLGAWTLFLGFVLFIWGIRDENMIQWTGGVVDLIVGALCFAPSVHFFAVRQKENIRWPEKAIVAVVFLLLLASVFSALVGVNLYRITMEREARRYGEEALRRIFIENDTGFLLDEATERWKQNPHGALGVTRPLTDKYLRLGDVQNTRVTVVAVRSLYEFPARVRYVGVIDGHGFARCGQVNLRLEVNRSAQGWRISGFWWQCPNT